MKYVSFILVTLFFIFNSCEENDIPQPEINESLPDNYVSAIFVNSDGVKYFATKKGLASFDGSKWKVYHNNPKISVESINDLGYEKTSSGDELWLATNKGANVINMPVDATSGATTYTKSNTQALFPGGEPLAGDSVFNVKIDNKNIRWFGTNGGLSAFQGSKWPKINFGYHYNSSFFRDNRITGIDYNGDTIYIATKGGGVARMVAKNVDAITAASPYEIPWSQLPSPNVLCVFTDGSTQWYGTDEGLARHKGTQAKLNWESFYATNGLASNIIQCISKDLNGKIWVGTPAGVSVFNGTQWKSYTKTDGLVDNNVLCIANDLDGTIWFGTSNGVSAFDGTKWTNYIAD